MTPSPCCVYCFYRSLNLASWKLLSALFIFAHRCPLSQPKTPASNFSDESMMGKPCALRVFSQTFLAVRGLGGTRHAITLEVGRFRSHSTFSLARMSFHCWLSLSLSQKQHERGDAVLNVLNFFALSCSSFHLLSSCRLRLQPERWKLQCSLSQILSNVVTKLSYTVRPSATAFSRFCLSWVKRASSSCHSAACTKCAD